MSLKMRLTVGSFAVGTIVVAAAPAAVAAPCSDVEYGECLAVAAGASTGGGAGGQVTGVGTFIAEEGPSGKSSIWFDFECRAEAPGAQTTRVDECLLLTNGKGGAPISLAATPVAQGGYSAGTAGQGEGWYCGYWVLDADFACFQNERVPTLCWKVSAVFPNSQVAESSGCADRLPWG